MTSRFLRSTSFFYFLFYFLIFCLLPTSALSTLFGKETEKYIAVSAISFWSTRVNKSLIQVTLTSSKHHLDSIFSNTDTICCSRLRAVITFKEIAAASMVNPSRVPFGGFNVVNIGTRQDNKSFGRGDSPIDCVFFGQVAEGGSQLITPTSPDSLGRVKKFIRFIPLACESIRAMATCKEVLWSGLEDDEQVHFRLSSDGAWEASTILLNPSSSTREYTAFNL
jgi:hypothetical protein